MADHREEPKGPTLYANWPQGRRNIFMEHVERFVFVLVIILAVISVGALLAAATITLWEVHGMRAVIVIGSIVVGLVVLWRLTAVRDA